MSKQEKLFGVALVVAMALVVVGCRKTSSSDSSSSGSGGSSASGGSGGSSGGGGGSGGGGAQTSGVTAEAQSAAMGEVARHWVKGPEGWITARVSGAPTAPDRYLRQMREIAVQGVEAADLDSADKLNGIEWAGQVSFNSGACREAGDRGILLDGLAGPNVWRQRGRWTQWAEITPEPIQLRKVKGKWVFTEDTWLLRGAQPTAADYQNAGVK